MASMNSSDRNSAALTNVEDILSRRELPDNSSGPPNQQNNIEAAAQYNKEAGIYHQEFVDHGFTTTAGELPHGYYHSVYFIGSCFAIVTSASAAWAGFGYIGPILAQIDADIGPSPNILWVALVYTLGLAIGLTLVGRLSDLFGRRWFFIGGALMGLVGATVCATAQNVNTLIGGETLIGLSSSAGLSYIMTLGELVPMKYRFIANGLIYIFSYASGGFGATIAESLVLHTGPSWRWCYYVIIIFNGAAAVSWFLFYHPPTFHMKWGTESSIQIIKNFDFVGTILYLAGLLLFIMGLSWGGSAYPWNSARVIATIIVGFLCLVGLVCWELLGGPREPLIPVHLFKNRGYIMSVLLLSMGASVYYAFALLWPSMVGTIYEPNNPMRAGWISAIVGVGISTGEFSGGCLAERIGKVKYQCVTAISLGGIFLAVAAVCTPDTRRTAIALVSLSSFCIGWNEAIAFSLTTICIKDQQDIGVSSGFGGSTRSAISTVASTIYQVILRSRLTETIPARVIPAVIAAGLPSASAPAFLAAYSLGTPAAFDAVKGITPSIIAAGTRAYQLGNSDAYRTVFLSTIPFSAIAVGLALFVPNVEELMTLDIATTLHSRTNENVVGSSQDAKVVDIYRMS